MVVMFTARRLKPGAWEQFRNAWDPGDAARPASNGPTTRATSVTRTR